MTELKDPRVLDLFEYKLRMQFFNFLLCLFMGVCFFFFSLGFWRSSGVVDSLQIPRFLVDFQYSSNEKFLIGWNL